MKPAPRKTVAEAGIAAEAAAALSA